MTASDGNDIDRALIRKVLVDSDNYLWIGTISGLYRLQLNAEDGTQLTAMQGEMMKAAKIIIQLNLSYQFTSLTIKQYG